ncbi:hypothetical protein MTR67_050588 [Solanum verrucosum]|uniref:Uncharacterized protein n=1 Tax=Solanum verrucosum TaxID=315347 RepID=A0AAF0V1R4_SOLVR|nr:hypothetical protein MTR67_050588 [Solanum verrucosum]
MADHREQGRFVG